MAQGAEDLDDAWARGGVARRAVSDTHTHTAARPVAGGYFWRVTRPVYHIEIPLNANGGGPATPDETVKTAHEVWDQLARTLCVCSCAEDAVLVANAVNAFRR